MSALPSRQLPVQRFTPTHGTMVGYLGLAVAAAVVATLAVTEQTLTGLRFALGIGVAAVLIWAALVRPRATAYAETLVLHHMFSDTHLPLARIDSVVVRQMLYVWIGEKRYGCAGIGRSTRQLLKRRSRGVAGVIGLAQPQPDVGAGGVGGIGEGADYATFVETRIEQLAHAARRDLRGEPPPVRRSWAIRELVAAGGLSAVFVVSLLV